MPSKPETNAPPVPNVAAARTFFVADPSTNKPNEPAPNPPAIKLVPTNSQSEISASLTAYL